MIGDGTDLASFGGSGGGISIDAGWRARLSFMMMVLRRLMLLSRRKGIPGDNLDGEVGV